MRANDLPLAVPSNKLADVRWHWLWFHTQSCPYDDLPIVASPDSEDRPFG